MDKFTAALGLLVCALIALRLSVGPARRQRFDGGCQRLYQRLGTRLTQMRRKTARPGAVDPLAAQREAEAAIERARQRRHDVDQDGNVIRPRAFDPSKKKPPLH